MNFVNALSNPNAIGTRRRLKRINRRSATHKLANRWLKILCIDLKKVDHFTVVVRLSLKLSTFWTKLKDLKCFQQILDYQ